MVGRHERAKPAQVAAYRWMARAALSATGASIALMIVLGVEGPRAGTAMFPPAPPWPPWFLHLDPSPVLGSITLWLAELLGGVGLALALLAARRGWRPRPRRLILGSVVAVIALVFVPPVDNGDPILYAAQGRITVLGHSPYVMTPGQLRSSGDPVGAVLGPAHWKFPSRYGPGPTGT